MNADRNSQQSSELQQLREISGELSRLRAQLSSQASSGDVPVERSKLFYRLSLRCDQAMVVADRIGNSELGAWVDGLLLELAETDLLASNWHARATAVLDQVAACIARQRSRMGRALRRQLPVPQRRRAFPRALVLETPERVAA